MQVQKPFQDVESRPDFAFLERELLGIWQEKRIFERSVEERPVDREFFFYDGPPFANGLPHYGHLLQGTMKDAILRYKTMQGYRVERRFGWDCHGLPIEFEMEQALNLQGRPDILKFGIANYNEECRKNVLKYTKEWRTITERLGRFVDFDRDYKTMDRSFMETVWWVFKRLYDKGLIYEGRKVLPYSWRVSTPLSNFEANLNYKDCQDPSVTVKIPLQNRPDTFFLIWTTTPWTLPSNLAICVHPDLEYVEVLSSGSHYILAKSRLEAVFRTAEYTIVKTCSGKDLEGLAYQPLFPFAAKEIQADKLFTVLNDTYVSDDSGTGIVHQAPAFGEDDLRVCSRYGIPVFDPVDEDGNFKPLIEPVSGLNFKEADKTLCRILKEKGLLFRQETLDHSYPFCWRTDTALMYKAISTWFVKVEAFKDRLVANNQKINWVPEHIRDGRFGNWLENARDWAISRNRFWGTPIPVWKSDEGDILVFGSVQELVEATGQDIPDLHKHFVDDLVIQKNGKTYRRIPEVLDCWFESGSMPYAQQHYPFENQARFEANFPADFIGEAIDQTRGWFYTLHVLSTALFDRPAFKNVICTGLILAPDGRKLSKRHKNFTPPMEIMDQFGADALRFFLVTSPVVKAQEVKVSDNEFKEVVKSLILPLYNVFSFFVTYANLDGYQPQGLKNSQNPLDRYILSEFQILLKTMTRAMDSYQLSETARPVLNFIGSLTNWYVRRSRRRFWASGINEDKTSAYETLYYVLKGLCKILAPLTPFLSDHIYRHLTKEDSVHLSLWDPVEEDLILEGLSLEMNQVRALVTLGHQLRKKNNIRVRQPLKTMRVAGKIDQAVLLAYQDVICEELNLKGLEWVAEGSLLGQPVVKLNFKLLGARLGPRMKEISNLAKNGQFKTVDQGIEIDGLFLNAEEAQILFQAQPGFDCQSEDGLVVSLDLNQDQALIAEGLSREIIRHVQTLRKAAGFAIQDRIAIEWFCLSKEIIEALNQFKSQICSETLALSLSQMSEEPNDIQPVEIDEELLYLRLARRP